MKQKKKYTYKVKDHDPLGDNRNLIDFIKGKKVNKFIMLNE